MSTRYPFCDPDGDTRCSACGAQLKGRRVLVEGERFPDDVFCGSACLQVAIDAADADAAEKEER